MDKRVCVVIPEFDECFLLVLFIYLFIYFYVGHLIIDGGYPCMIETSETVDVVALKNPCSHLNLCPLILFNLKFQGIVYGPK